MNEIFVLSVEDNDPDSHPVSIDGDLGYYLTREAAQARADELSQNRKGYDEYVSRIEQENASRVGAYAYALQVHQVLLKNGIPSKEPPKAREVAIISFDAWHGFWGQNYWVEALQPGQEASS